MPKKLGPYYQVPDAWKLQVRAKLATRGDRVAAARAIGVSQAAVSQLLRLSSEKTPGPGTSRIAKPLADHVGIPLPGAEGADDDVAALTLDVSRLMQEDPEAARSAIASFRALLRQLTKRQI